MIAKIYINLKEAISDPQGMAVKHALEALGYTDLAEVRVGKFITIKLTGQDKKGAGKRIKQMCDNLLANPVIENYYFEIKEA